MRSKEYKSRFPVPLIGVLLLALFLGTFSGFAEAETSGDRVSTELATRSLLLDCVRAGDRLLAAGARGIILYSDDQGGTWQSAAVPVQTLITRLSFADAQRGWAVGHDAVILSSQDGGVSWREVYRNPELESPLFDIAFFDEQRGLAVGAYGLMLTTADGGLHWETQPVGDNDFHLNRIALAADGTAFLAAEAGRVFRSRDRGLSWELFSTPYHGSFYGLLLGSKGLYAYGMRGHLYLSTDQGESWGELATGTNSLLADAAQLQDGRQVIVGLNGTLLIDDGQGGDFIRYQEPGRAGFCAVLENLDGLLLAGERGLMLLPLNELENWRVVKDK